MILINQYPLKTESCIRKAFKAFIETPRLRGYSDAIGRSGTEEQRNHITETLNTFIKQLFETLNYKKSPNNAKTSENDMLNVISEHQKSMDALEEMIIKYGDLALQTEDQAARREAKPFSLMSFDEYNQHAWKNLNVNAKYLEPTPLKFTTYLSYVRTLLTPYTKTPLPTENRKQALQFCANLDAMLGKLHNAENTLLKSSDRFFEINQAIKNNKTAELLDERQKLLGKIHETSQFYSAADGTLDKTADPYNMCQPELEYWELNFPRIHNRQPDIQKLYQFSEIPSKSYTDVLFRYVKEGELNNLRSIKQLAQSSNSLEREKWFFEPNGNPGAGVTYPYRCKIFLKEGSLDVLHDLTKKDGEFATVVKKPNEHNCTGIHEDALPILNTLIDKVGVFKTTTPNDNEYCKVSFDTQENIKSLELMFSTLSLTADKTIENKAEKKKGKNRFKR